MTTFNTSLAAAINAAMGTNPTKLNWSGTIGTQMGNNRRIRCLRDANANAADPATTGVEFLNMSSTGPLTITAGNITGFGTLSGITKRLAADLSTGSSVLVLEGNGYAITYTLGLPGSGKDFTLSASPTGSPNEGYAFALGSGTKAPILLDSGTGPLSPTLTADAPHHVDLEDWSSGSAVLVGSIPFDQRIANWVFDDAQVSANMGDVKCYQSSQSITWGGQEWGAIMFAMTGQANAQSSDPVYQVLAGRLPTSANWPNYPTWAGYQMGVTDTYVPAHKMVVRRQDGTILHTYEMRDSLPMNHVSLVDNDRVNKPVRRWMNCGQLLPWQSSRPKMNSFAQQWHPGMEGGCLRNTAARGHYATNSAIPQLSGSQNWDGTRQWYLVPKWSHARSAAGVAEAEPSQDPYGNNDFTINYVTTGWGYEPACLGQIENYTGPGGTRNDRSCIPTVLALKYSNPSYVRPRNGETITELADHWNLQYFNLSHHYLLSAKTFSTLPIDDVLLGKYGHGKSYYAGLDTYVSGGAAYTVPLFAIGNQQVRDTTKPYDVADASSGQVDKNGRLTWGGDAVDYLHNYTTPAWTALYENSPMHAYATKHRLITSILCQLGGDGSEDPREYFLIRRHAFRYHHLTMAWKLTSDHPYGIPRKLVEDRFQRELEAVYNYTRNSVLVSNDPTPYFQALKNLGLPLRGDNFVASTGQTFFLSQAFQQMRQFGLWTVMWNKSDKCREALKFIIRCLDLYAIDFILDTDGWNENPSKVMKGSDGISGAVASSWADWMTVYPKADPRMDWITSFSGVKYGFSGALGIPYVHSDGQTRSDPATGSKEQSMEQHLRYQYACVRRDYLPEIACDRGPTAIADAIAKYEGFYAQINATVTASPSRDTDWTWYWASLGKIKAPTQLTP